MARIRKRGNSFSVEVVKGRTPDGRPITESTTFKPDPNKTDRQNEKALQAFALDYERKVKNDLTRADSLSFQKFAEEWISVYGEKELSPTTLKTYIYSLKVLYPLCGYEKLSAFRPSTVQRILNDLEENGYEYGSRKGKYAPDTIRTFKIVLSSVLSAAVEDGIIPSNPCNIRQRQKHKKTEEKEIQCFTPEEAYLFMDAIRKPIPVYTDAHPAKRNGKVINIKAHVNRVINVATKYLALFTIAIYSGCRRGELLALTWEDIDFKENTIRIRKTAAYTPELGQYIDAPKTKSGYRSIKLPTVAMDVIRLLKNEQREEILLKGSAWISDRTQRTGFLFCQEDGKMMAVSTPTKEFKRILRAINKNLKAEEKDTLPDISFHDLRHTSASILIAEGEDPVTVAARLGHSEATTTLKIYSHAFSERDNQAADALEKAIQRAEKRAK